MIIEVDLSIFEKIDTITINQMVVLSLVLKKIKTNNQNFKHLFSRINEAEIQDLITQEYITQDELTKELKATDKLTSLFKEDETLFDQFYALYPIYVVRPDGTKGFLRANVNKCRKEYNRIIGKSRSMHDHLYNCLKFDIDNKMSTGKLGYMKTMWTWLVQHEWEAIEEQLKYEQETPVTNTYGNELI